MEKLKRFIKESWLALWIIGWPGIAFAIGWYNWGIEFQTWHLMAYFMQLGAFTIIIRRLNSLFSHFHPEQWGYLKAIWEWIKSFFTNHSKVYPMGVVSGTDLGSVRQLFSPIPNDSTKEEIIKWLNKEIFLLNEKINDEEKVRIEQIKELRQEVYLNLDEIKKKLNEEKKATRQLQLPNLGRELVAMLWLILAAATFAFTNLIA